MLCDESEAVGDTIENNATEDTPSKDPQEEGEAKKRKTMEKRSEVWDHFTPYLDNNKKQRAKCVHCGKTFCGESKNGTSSLKGHLSKCTKLSTIGPRQTQLVLQSGQSSSLSSWNFEQEEVRKALAYMIIVDELPFKFVEGEGFKYFCLKSCPQFKIPSRWSVSRDCFKFYEDEKKLLMTLLKSANQRVCLTTDTWTSCQKVNYMCLTAHYIDNDWKLNKKIINFCPISSHKGIDIGLEIEKCLHDWGINRVFTITVDNASSNNTALVYLKRTIRQWGESVGNCDYMHMRCIAHIFNLVVQKGLKEIGPSVKKIRNAVRFIRHSPTRLGKFKECCELEKISSKSMLCLDVATRWNSTFFMLEAATTFEKAFYRYELIDSSYKKDLEVKQKDLEVDDDDDDEDEDVDGDGDRVQGVPKEEDWRKAKLMLNFLRIFYEATSKISGSLYVTSNLFLHEIYKVHALLNAFIEGDDFELSIMAKKMKEKFDKYWGNPRKMNKLIFIAVVVDPRYKLKLVKLLLAYMYDDELANSFGNEVEAELVNMCGDYKQPIVQQNVGHAELNLSNATRDDNDVLKNAMKMVGSLYETFHQRHDEVNDVQKYLKEDIEIGGPKFDLLDWWKNNEYKYPVLSQAARDILAVPISTVASESAFSTGGRVLDPFRSSLSPKVVEYLVCGQNWLRKSSKFSVEEIFEDVQKIEHGI